MPYGGIPTPYFPPYGAAYAPALDPLVGPPTVSTPCATPLGGSGLAPPVVEAPFAGFPYYGASYAQPVVQAPQWAIQ